jgi:hypothetical protein
MSPYYLLAVDLARERTRALEAEARRDRLAHDAVTFGRGHRPSSPGRLRAVAAAALRRVGAGADGLADAACRAASRVEGQAA